MSLQDWIRNGWLAEHEASPQEIADALAVVDRDLKDCRARGLSADWRMSIAYNAALQSATAALAAAGFRPRGEGHHFRTIQSLALTIGLEKAEIALFDQFRKKRNLSGYGRAGAVSDQEAEEMGQFARKLRGKVTEWLRSEHPGLMKD